MIGGKLGAHELLVIRGEPMDKLLRLENAVLRDALGIAVSALKFDDSLCARSALRLIRNRLNDGGLAQFVAELRALQARGYSGSGESEQ